MTRLHAGLDWSGRPFLVNKQPDFYVVAVAAVEDPDGLQAICDALRIRFNMGLREEFHGHICPEEIQAMLLEELRLCHLHVSILALDKTRAELPAPTVVTMQSALLALRGMLHLAPLSHLAYDEDIQGRQPQQRFKTATLRLHRDIYPGAKLKVSCTPSHKSHMIQVADVLAYGFSRLLRGAVMDVELRRQLESMRQSSTTVINNCISWEEVAKWDDLRP